MRSILFALAFAAAYFLVWRPVRVWTTNEVVRPALERVTAADAPIRFVSRARPGLYVDRTDIEKIYVFNGFGNAFFLFGGLYFLAFGHGWRPVGWLFLIHQGLSALALLSLFLAVTLHPAWLYAMNLLVTYLTPAATGMFVLGKGGKG
jgi:hypothetical protein